MVLLMCFFVLMLSFSEMDEQKFKLMSGSLTETFGVQTDVTATDPPKGTSLEATEFSPAIPEPTTENEVRQHTVDSDLNTLDLGLELRLRELKAQEDAAAGQAQELRAVFQQDIEDGRLLIRQEGTNVVIQLLEKDSFPSGSAALEADSRAGAGPSRCLGRGNDGSHHGLGAHGQRSDPRWGPVSIELGALSRARRVGGT